MHTFGKVTNVERTTWAGEAARAARESYFAAQFMRGAPATAPVSMFKRAWWRVRRFFRGFVYVECECGARVNRWTGGSH
jgi:hypothetical protein